MGLFAMMEMAAQALLPLLTRAKAENARQDL
jgi:hypothetical protein